MFLGACSGDVVGPATLETQAETSERYVLVYNGDSVPAKAQAAIEAAGGQLVSTLPQVGIAVAVSSNPDFAAAAEGGGVQAVGVAPASALPDGAVSAPAALEAPTPADAFYNSR